MKHKYVIFDWDGTLMDSVGRIVKCMQLIAKELSLTVPSSDDVKGIIGISLYPGIKQLFPSATDEMVEKLFDGYKSHYLKLDETPSPMFDGVDTMLSRLCEQGHELAVATGKARRGLVRAWNHHQGFADYFVASRCADETESKPHPDMLNQLLNERQFSIREAVMVGDSVHDLNMAKSIGMDCIGVSFGAASKESLQALEPLAVVDSIAELDSFLLDFNKRQPA
jgi:phosphoglycolate phosphatase